MSKRGRRMPSVMTHRFSQVPKANIPRSTFDRSFGYKSTFSSGLLIPFYVDEALPGDTFNLKMQGFARMATPIHPIMDNLVLETFFFAVPNRILWDNWVKFMGEQRNPGDSTDFTIPQISSPPGNGWASMSLGDYFGLPVNTAQPYSVSALPFRAYSKIWNEWFRDENLANSLVENVDDGPDSYVNYRVTRRGKRHDYFTSCLPWPQKGESVSIPLGDTAPVVSTDDIVYLNTEAYNTGTMQVVAGAGSNITFSGTSSGALALKFAREQDQAGATGLETDLTSATAVTINELRQGFQIQKMLERDARGGTRYTEKIRAHFGVTSPDARQQRPEYLGGGRSPVVISPVAQTQRTDQDESPLGNLAAIGTVSVAGHGFMKSFTEHCTLIGVLCVRADLTYSQGVDRMWLRKTIYDFYWPALSHIGEQAVETQEIYKTGVQAEDEVVFGYQERYAEYRYKPSKITGLFRTNVSGNNTSLDTWHLSEYFSTPPVLNEAFIEEDPPVGRVQAVQTEPQFIFDSWSLLRCARPMPVYGVPGLIDHF